MLLVILFLLVLSGLCNAMDLGSFDFEFSLDMDLEEIWDDWLDPNKYFVMLTPENQVIVETSRVIYPGDQYLTSDNLLYEVTEIDDNIAYTKFVEKVQLEDNFLSIQQVRQALGLAVAQAEDNKTTGKIGVYHTHNAESYVPTDGVASIDGQGGIHAVGLAFTQALEKLGVSVDFSEKLHLPHDKGAYRRSRNTVLSLLSGNPDAIFDIHRDAAPINAYAAQIDEEWVTQVQFVVGRQNQNLGINRQYAQSLKKIADQVYPGLVKGIFYGRGNYNQDLTPLSLLLEAGAHTNSRDAAERGVSLFAEVVDFYFYGPVENRPETGQTKSLNLIATRTVVWLVIFLFLGLIVFYVINAGSWQAALNKLRRK